jgi:hypothetical protein
LDKKVVVRIIVNLFHEKIGEREGGFGRRERNSEAAKGDAENYACVEAIVKSKKYLKVNSTVTVLSMDADN